MKSSKHIILIPVYNDWRSLNKLLSEIDIALKDSRFLQTEILIINDCSTMNISIDKNNFKTIKKISVITLKQNLGSQKSIAIGLNYLKKLDNNFFITVMDGDGEDSPYEITKMLENAQNHENHVITSNRKKRKETFLIILFYRIHLIISFLFSFHWITFGNFTTFNAKNLKKLLSNNCSWYAHSSSVIKNCNIKKLFAKREKRYFDKSKLGFISLVEHSLRINTVFLHRIFFSSILYSALIFYLVPKNINYFFIILILLFNIILLIVKKIHFIKNFSDIDNLIEDAKSI